MSTYRTKRGSVVKWEKLLRRAYRKRNSEPASLQKRQTVMRTCRKLNFTLYYYDYNSYLLLQARYFIFVFISFYHYTWNI